MCGRAYLLINIYIDCNNNNINDTINQNAHHKKLNTCYDTWHMTLYVYAMRWMFSILFKRLLDSTSSNWPLTNIYFLFTFWHQYRFIKHSHKTTLLFFIIIIIVYAVFFNYITRRHSLTYRIIIEKKKGGKKLNKAVKISIKCPFYAYTVFSFRCG